MSLQCLEKLAHNSGCSSVGWEAVQPQGPLSQCMTWNTHATLNRTSEWAKAPSTPAVNQWMTGTILNKRILHDFQNGANLSTSLCLYLSRETTWTVTTQSSTMNFICSCLGTTEESLATCIWSWLLIWKLQNIRKCSATLVQYILCGDFQITLYKTLSQSSINHF